MRATGAWSGTVLLDVGMSWFRVDGGFCEVEDDGRELFLVNGAPMVG